MSETLFRGKRINNGEWVYGYLSIPMTSGVYDKDARVIIKEEIDGIEEYSVYPPTIGMWTGLKDKNGTMIFEGDYVKANTYNPKIVLFFRGAFRLKSLWSAKPFESMVFGTDYDLDNGDSARSSRFRQNPQSYEVVGNRYEGEV